MKPGRACKGCHAAENVKRVQKGELELTWLEGDALVNRKGVIPVVDSVEYRCVYQPFNDGNWTLIENPQKPLRQYPAFGKPLTGEQLEKLAKKQVAPPPKME